MIPVPDKCLICGAEWSGGNQKPGGQMKSLSLAYYICGAKIICERLCNGYKILIINCGNADAECTCDGEVGNNDIYYPVHCQPCYR